MNMPIPFRLNIHQGNDTTSFHHNDISFCFRIMTPMPAIYPLKAPYVSFLYKSMGSFLFYVILTFH